MMSYGSVTVICGANEAVSATPAVHLGNLRRHLNRNLVSGNLRETRGGGGGALPPSRSHQHRSVNVARYTHKSC